MIYTGRFRRMQQKVEPAWGEPHSTGTKFVPFLVLNRLSRQNLELDLGVPTNGKQTVVSFAEIQRKILSGQPI